MTKYLENKSNYKTLPMNLDESKIYYENSNIIDLSDEFLSYKTTEEKKSKQYTLLKDEILSRKLPKELMAKSIDSIVNKCSSDKAKVCINFYNNIKKNKRRFGKNNLNQFSAKKLMSMITESFGYEELRSNTSKSIMGFSYNEYMKGKYFQDISSI